MVQAYLSGACFMSGIGAHVSFGGENMSHRRYGMDYRYKVLKGDVAERVRELMRKACEAFKIRIVQGVVSKDHAHILVSCPPEMAPSEIMRRIKS